MQGRWCWDNCQDAMDAIVTGDGRKALSDKGVERPGLSLSGFIRTFDDPASDPESDEQPLKVHQHGLRK